MQTSFPNRTCTNLKKESFFQGVPKLALKAKLNSYPVKERRRKKKKHDFFPAFITISFTNSHSNISNYLFMYLKSVTLATFPY